MKKPIIRCLAVQALLVGGLSFGSAFGDVRYIWNRPSNDANWNTPTNWQMGDGTTATDYPNRTDAIVVYREDRGLGIAGLMPSGHLYISLKELRFEGCGGKWGQTDSESDETIAQTLTYQGYLKFAAGGGIFFPDLPKRSPQGLYYYLSTVMGCQGSGEVVCDIPGNVEMNFDKADVYHPADDSANSPVLVKRGEGLLCLGNGTGKPGVALKIEEGTLRLVFAPTSKDVAYPLIFAGDNAKVTIDKRAGAAGGLFFGTGYLSETEAVTGGRHSIDSQCGSVLGFYGATAVEKQTFSGCLTGNVGLEFKPSVAGRELCFKKGVSTTKGGITVANGTLRVTDGAAFPNVGVVTVNGGKLIIEEDGAAAFPNAAFQLYNGAQISAAAGCRVALKVVGNVAAGVYKATGSSQAEGTEASWVGGEGLIVVGSPAEATAVAATWNGAGGDSSAFTLGNWNGATTLPDLTSGTASIAMSAGLQFIADLQSVAVRGFTMNKQHVAVGAAVGKELRIGSGGLSNPSSGVVTFGGTGTGGDVVLTANQTWNPNQGHIVIRNPVRTLGQSELTVQGMGGTELRLEAATPDWNAPVMVKEMLVQFKASNAFGSYQGVPVTIFNKGEAYSPTFANGIEVNRPLVVADSSKASGGWTTLTIPENANVTFNAPIVSSNDTILAINAKAGSRVVFNDLFASRSSGWISGSGTIVFNGPYHCRDRFYNYSSCTIELHATGNRFNGNMGIWTNGTIKTMVPYAFSAANTRRFTTSGTNNSTDGTTRTCIYMRENAVLDLCGNDQSFGDMVTRGGVITSATPATYYMDFTASAAPYDGAAKTRSDQAVYAGAVNYSKWGNLPRWFMAVSTSTGIVEVAEGTLTFTSATGGQVDLNPGGTATLIDRLLGSWRKATAAVVKGGTLVLEHSQALGRKTDVKFVKRNNAYGKIQLNEGVSQTVRNLYVDGVKQPYGTYGSSSSLAQYKDDVRFAGSGVLNVSGVPGLAILVR